MTPPDTVFKSAHDWLQVGRFDQAFPLFLSALSKYESMKQTGEVICQVCRCRYLGAKAAAFLGKVATTKVDCFIEGRRPDRAVGARPADKGSSLLHLWRIPG